MHKENPDGHDPAKDETVCSTYATSSCTAPSAGRAQASGLSVDDELVFDRNEVEFLISISTVRSHIHIIYGKLGARNRTQAVTRVCEVNLF